MSPFAVKLKQIREARGIKQKDLAHQLGYEPSYLSALERSEKGPPSQDFIRRLVSSLGLTECEQAELGKTIQFSRRQISLPTSASEEEYEFLHLLEPNLGQLRPQQLQLMKLILFAPPSLWNAGDVVGLGCVQSTRMEASKM